MRIISLVFLLVCFQTSFSQIKALTDKEVYENLWALVPTNWDVISGSEYGLDFAMMRTDSSGIFNDNINLVAHTKTTEMNLKDFANLIAKQFAQSYGLTEPIAIQGEEGSNLYILKSDLEANVQNSNIPLTAVVYMFEYEDMYFQFTYLGLTESYTTQKFLVNQMLKSACN